MSSWPHTFATQYPSVALSWLDDQFNQLSLGSTGTISIAGAALVGYQATASLSVATTAQSKLREVVSVLDFMTASQRADVISYGYATDATPSLQAAFNTGASCFIPDGGYSVSSNGVSISSGGKKVWGSHALRVIWKLAGAMNNTGSGAGSMLYCNTVNNFEISGITFDWNSQTQAVLGPSLACLTVSQCNDWNVSRCRFIGWMTRGLELKIVQRFSVRENLFDRGSTSPNNNECIEAEISASRGEIAGNWLLNAGMALVGQLLHIRDNIIDTFGFGAGITIQQDSGTNQNIIHGNTVTGGTGVDENGYPPGGIESWGPRTIVTNNMCYSNAGPGMEHGSNKGVVSGNLFFDNGVGGGAGTGSGIRLRGADTTYNCSNSTVIGNRCFDSSGVGGGGNQGFGISVYPSGGEATNIAGVHITGNNLNGNDVSPYSIAATTGVMIIEGNTPIASFNSISGSAPNVINSDSNIFILSQTATTSVTSFLNGVTGKIYTFRSTDTNSILVYNASTFNIQGGVNFTMGNGAVITMVKYNDSVWVELSRRTA